nr:MAG TPA: hypothetical protein [Caudoviricetes sp.]
MTNREWLQTLTDEEFAENMRCSCFHCIFYVNEEGKGVCTATMGAFCGEGISLWLQKEHKEKDSL